MANTISAHRGPIAPRPGLPIILVTGYLDRSAECLLSKSGVKTVLHKPLAMDALGMAVRSALSG